MRVAEYFLNIGFFVIAPVRNTKIKNFKRKNIIFCSYHNLENIIANKKVDYIFHFASLTSVNHNDQNLIYKTNIDLAHFVSNLAKKHLPKMIIFTSTISIYGEIIDSLLTFNTPINANKVDAYGKSKLKAEQILTECSNENRLKIVVFRLPGVIGFGSHSNLISKVIETLLSDRRDPLYLMNPQNMFNNIIDIKTFSLYLEKLISTHYKDFAQIKTIISCKEPLRIIDVIKSIIKNLDLDESNNKKIVWSHSRANSFIIDSEFQKRFSLEPISTEECIKNICNDILKNKK